MPSQGVHQERRKRARRFAAVVTGVLIVCSTWAGQAYAQTPDGPAAVDQYVEDVPTTGGSTIPGKNKPKKKPLPPRVSNQIKSQGGSDAEVLEEVAASPDYGAPAPTSPPASVSAPPPAPAATSPKTKTKKARAKKARSAPAQISRSARDVGGEIPAVPDSSASEAVSAAVTTVQSGDAARLVGLLIALFVISVGALAAAGLRSKRRAGAP